MFVACCWLVSELWMSFVTLFVVLNSELRGDINLITQPKLQLNMDKICGEYRTPVDTIIRYFRVTNCSIPLTVSVDMLAINGKRSVVKPYCHISETLDACPKPPRSHRSWGDLKAWRSAPWLLAYLAWEGHNSMFFGTGVGKGAFNNFPIIGFTMS